MYSLEADAVLPPEETDALLLSVARGSVVHGLQEGAPLPVDPAVFPEPLQASEACFVTLRVRGELRGCVGSLEPRAPLVVEAARNAYLAAFQDTRFAPLRERDLDELETHVSILGPFEPLEADSEAALLRALRPGVDGLVLSAGRRSATFLPAVWSQIPEPRDFLRALERKAGLPEGGWSPGWRFERFTTRDVG